MKAYNLTRRCPLILEGERATRFFARLKGLIGHPPLERGQGMMIAPCRWIHTFAMRFPIDVLYVDKKGRIVYLTPGMVPNRIGPYVWKADFVLELPVGTIACTGTKLGDQLAIEP